MVRPSSTAADDRCEVVVAEDHVRGFLRNIGAGDAHGDADVGLAQSGGVVDPVARHRHDVTFALQGLYDLELVFRRDPRVDGHFVDKALKLRNGHPLKIVAREQTSAIGDTQLPGDLKGRQGMVARDHDWTDASCPARAHREGDFGPRWIDQPDQPDEDEILLHLGDDVAIRRRRRRLQPAERYSQHAHTLSGHLLCGSADTPANIAASAARTHRSPQTPLHSAMSPSGAPLVKAT